MGRRRIGEASFRCCPGGYFFGSHPHDLEFSVIAPPRFLPYASFHESALLNFLSTRGVHSKWFVAWLPNGDGTYDLYRLGKAKGSPYNVYESTLISPLTGTAPTGAISLEQNTDRPGIDYSSYALSSADPQICANDCANDPNCKAFTYVKPGVRGPNSVPECHLKSGVPNAVSGDCCVSGAKA